MNRWSDISANIESAGSTDTESVSGSRWAAKSNEMSSGDEFKLANPEDEGWMSALKKTLVSIPRSGFEYGKNIYQALRHPVESAKTMGKAGINLMQPLAEANITLSAILAGEEVPEFSGEVYYPEADMVEMLKQRYGSLDAFKETLTDDPVGTMADISSILYPAGKLAGISGMTKTANVLNKAAMVTEPMNALGVGTSTLRKVGTAIIPKAIPSKLYESAVKISTALPLEQRRRIVNTALEKQIMPTYNGLTKLKGGIDVLNTKITSLIDEAAATGQTIPIDDLFKNFYDMEENILKVSGEPIKGFNKFEAVKNEIKKANEALGRSELTPKEAQLMKQRIYKELDKEYNRVSLHPISAEARMAVARNLKEAIEEIIPEVKQLNANESELIELQNALTRATERISNRDLLSLGTTAKAAGGAAVAGGPGLATGLLLGLLDSQPIIKSKLALVLHKVKSKGIKTKPTMLGAMLGLYQAGRLEQLGQEGSIDSKQFLQNMANIGKE